MLYKDLLNTITECPFCEPLRMNKIIAKNEDCFLTYSIAPYHQHHVMVIPYRHIRSFTELSEKETKSVDDLLRKAAGLLGALGYNDYTILVRNGETIGNSVKHVHYHIAPAAIIGDLKRKNADRIVLEQGDIDKLMKDFEEAESKIQQNICI
ncbi:MAG: HIT family protein [bacterium]